MTPNQLEAAQLMSAPEQSGAALKDRLHGHTGQEYWRTLEEFSGTEEFDALVHREFPNEADQLLDPVNRRNFLKVMGASMMLAGASSCSRQPDETIVPYVKQPESGIFGKPQFYATAMPFGGYGIGLLATSYEGRPTKLEGHPEHPASLGSTSTHAQSSILDLYDPDRLDTPSRAGNIGTWQQFFVDIASVLNEVDAAGGTGVRILTETVTSPTIAGQIRQFLARYPEARWHQFEPDARDHVRAGAQLAFGSPVETLYDFSQAQVILSLDSDFLREGPGHVRYSREFADSRDVDMTNGTMSRLYALTSSPTITDANADHKANLRYADVEQVAREIAARLGVPGISATGTTALAEPLLAALVQDLTGSAGRSVVIPGEYQTPAVHAIAHAINAHLGNVGTGKPVRLVQPVEAEPVFHYESLGTLVADMNAGQVGLLLILGGNPVYTAPADMNFAKGLDQVKLRAHLTPGSNETSYHCHWVLPESHYLEAWGDVRAYDGTVSIIQPLIHPLYNSRSCVEILAMLLGEEVPDGRLAVQQTWRTLRPEVGFDAFWDSTLASGIVPDTASAPSTATLALNLPAASPATEASGLDVLFRLDPTVHDGRYANNGWLQELPKPLTKLTWDNAVFISPVTAKAQGLDQDDVVEITHAGRKVQGAVFYQFGHPQHAITVHLGYGRTRVGRVGTGTGFNAYSLQGSDSPWFGTGAQLRKTGNKYQLAHTYEHWRIEQTTQDMADVAEKRHLIRETTLEDWRAHPDFAQHLGHHTPEEDFTLYKPSELPYKYETGYQWGMAIDLNRCTGCNVCMVACQAENNIAVVGKSQVIVGREMHWIRVDRYYKGDIHGEPQTVHQPVTCMHCENAPCEPVCPVAATMHSNEGLNDMVYNRCIGTRYCSNNCPYKVRRFNFYKYSDHTTPQLKLMRNPNVTVRSRGVMEKCTYCVQRINIARIDAKRENRPIADGEVVVACAAACPSRAISFGDASDKSTEVSRWKNSPRNYGLLADIGTRPRTTYLAGLRNPSPALAAAEPAGHGDTSEHHG